jgi:hypothetical protein
MSLLAWNYQGMGKNLGSPKMLHLVRLRSTNAQVIFISEMRNSKLTKTDLVNRFNVNDAHVVPARGRSGGLWLLFGCDVDLDVLESSHHFFFALCDGDPHHLQTATIWRQI